MSGYTELFVVPVVAARKDDYRKVAELYAAIVREHGALSYVELEADDAPFGKLTSFPRSVNLREGETVFLGMVGYWSRAHRDEVNAKVMKDARMASMGGPSCPFDMRRMYWAGFKPFIEA